MNKLLYCIWLIFSVSVFAEKPNILFIFSDDHATQAVSAYGSRLKDVAPTPHLDSIAKQGMLFKRCMVTNSICGPSRATILTGKYSHLNGFMTNETRKFEGLSRLFQSYFKVPVTKRLLLVNGIWEVSRQVLITGKYFRGRAVTTIPIFVRRTAG